MVQGSRQEFDGITSEQRTERPEGSLGCAGFAPDTAHTSAVFQKRNKSGTAEVISCLCLL